MPEEAEDPKITQFWHVESPKNAYRGRTGNEKEAITTKRNEKESNRTPEGAKGGKESKRWANTEENAHKNSQSAYLRDTPYVKGLVMPGDNDTDASTIKVLPGL